jgi:hypothetical protein
MTSHGALFCVQQGLKPLAVLSLFAGTNELICQQINSFVPAFLCDYAFE